MAILIAAVMLGRSVATPRDAQAQEEETEDPASRSENAALTFLTSVVAMTAVANTLGDEGKPVFLGGVAAAAAGSLSFYQSWEPAIPFAASGALWGGMGGVLVGASIDGLSHDGNARLGPWAYGLANAGALAGGWLGATRIDPGDASFGWFMWPAAGGVAGALIPPVTTLAVCLPVGRRCSLDGPVMRQVMRWSAAAGVTAGLVYGFYSSRGREGGGAGASPAAMLLLPPVRF